MSLIMITEAMKLMEETDADFGMEDKEFIAQYAFRTGDTDLVKKLIEVFATTNLSNPSRRPMIGSVLKSWNTAPNCPDMK